MIPNFKKAVFLDRDGVINKLLVCDGEFCPPFNLKELEILPGVKEGVQLLKRAGFLCIGITNQSDVGEGNLPRSNLEAINDVVKKELDLDSIYFVFIKRTLDAPAANPNRAWSFKQSWTLKLIRFSLLLSVTAGKILKWGKQSAAAPH